MGTPYLCAYDSRLIAINAKSGQEVWSAQTDDTTKSYTVTGAPRIMDGKVMIGNGGAEMGVRGEVAA